MTIQHLLTNGSHIISKIFTHPFNLQLANGTLPKQAFKLYLEQDALYLFKFAQALNLISGRFFDRRYAHQFKQLSREMLDAEINVHIRYLGKTPKSMVFFNVHQRNPIKQMPVISNYTHHLLETVTTGSIEEGVASCMPCFWIYHQLGRRMAQTPVSDNPFHLWISSYSSIRFQRSTLLMLQITDELFATISAPEARAKVSSAFLKSLHFELEFFDAVMADKNNHRNDFIHPFSTLILPK